MHGGWVLYLPGATAAPSHSHQIRNHSLGRQPDSGEKSDVVITRETLGVVAVTEGQRAMVSRMGVRWVICLGSRVQAHVPQKKGRKRKREREREREREGERERELSLFLFSGHTGSVWVLCSRVRVGW